MAGWPIVNYAVNVLFFGFFLGWCVYYMTGGAGKGKMKIDATEPLSKISKGDEAGLGPELEDDADVSRSTDVSEEGDSV
eukprot:SAG11_NODE_2732_length_3032_cov_1.784862_1_plen_79_part_00